MNSTEYKTIGNIERNLFREYKLQPLQDYEASVSTQPFPGSKITQYIDFSTDENCNVIKVKERMSTPFPELLFSSIEEIKNSDGSIVEKY